MSSSMGTYIVQILFFLYLDELLSDFAFCFLKYFRGKNNFFLKWCFSSPFCHYLLLMLLFLHAHSPLLFPTFFHNWHNESISSFSWLKCWQIALMLTSTAELERDPHVSFKAASLSISILFPSQFGGRHHGMHYNSSSQCCFLLRDWRHCLNVLSLWPLCKAFRPWIMHRKCTDTPTLAKGV